MVTAIHCAFIHVRDQAVCVTVQHKFFLLAIVLCFVFFFSTLFSLFSCPIVSLQWKLFDAHKQLIKATALCRLFLLLLLIILFWRWLKAPELIVEHGLNSTRTVISPEVLSWHNFLAYWMAHINPVEVSNLNTLLEFHFIFDSKITRNSYNILFNLIFFQFSISVRWRLSPRGDSKFLRKSFKNTNSSFFLSNFINLF